MKPIDSCACVPAEGLCFLRHVPGRTDGWPSSQPWHWCVSTRAVTDVSAPDPRRASPSTEYRATARCTAVANLVRAMSRCLLLITLLRTTLDHTQPRLASCNLKASPVFPWRRTCLDLLRPSLLAVSGARGHHGADERRVAGFSGMFEVRPCTVGGDGFTHTITGHVALDHLQRRTLLSILPIVCFSPRASSPM